ncbi:MAG TPA: hypothetical protein VM487_07910 [Phycisphaerae bacterium]|nr:hypothetical protein [Phycisphaerae bacterium]
MKSKTKPETPNLPRRILAQIGRFGLTTRVVVAATLTAGNRDKARGRLRRLTASGRIHCHEYVVGKQRFVYYTRHPEPLTPRRLYASFATLWFCRMGRRRFNLLPRGQMLRLTAELRGMSESLPSSAMSCALYHMRDEPLPRIALIRVDRQIDADHTDLNQSVTDLDRFVSGLSFRMWRRLAMLERFVLLYLVCGRQNSVELGRWLRRRPPVSRVAAPAVPLDVRVYPAMPLCFSDLPQR